MASAILMGEGRDYQRDSRKGSGQHFLQYPIRSAHSNKKVPEKEIKGTEFGVAGGLGSVSGGFR